MAHVSKSHERYRTHKQMAADVAIALNSPLSWGAKFAVLNNVCWAWTEIDGKYSGCKYWTKAALAERLRNPKAKLVHEHAVPRNVVITLLRDLKSPTARRVYALLSKTLVGVIVTREQHQRLNKGHSKSMPPEFFKRGSAYLDPWLRYRPFEKDAGFQRQELGRDAHDKFFKLQKLAKDIERNETTK